METSALNGDNIEKAFSELISDIFKSNHSSSDKKDSIKLEQAINLENIDDKDEEKEEPVKKKGCCN